MKVNIKKLPENIETELKNADTKVTKEYILELRAEAERQKLTKDAKAFAKTLGNEGRDVPTFKQESSSEMETLIEEFEIIDE